MSADKTPTMRGVDLKVEAARIVSKRYTELVDALFALGLIAQQQGDDAVIFRCVTAMRRLSATGTDLAISAAFTRAGRPTTDDEGRSVTARLVVVGRCQACCVEFRDAVTLDWLDSTPLFPHGAEDDASCFAATMVSAKGWILTGPPIERPSSTRLIAAEVTS